MESRVGYGGIPLDTPPQAVGSFIYLAPFPVSPLKKAGARLIASAQTMF